MSLPLRLGAPSGLFQASDPQGGKKLVVRGLSEGLLFSHPYPQPAGSRMLHVDAKLGPAPEHPGSCGPDTRLGSLGSWQLGSWLPHSPVGVLVLTECICTSQKCEKQTAKMKSSSCLLGISEHGSHDAWSPVERRMGEKPVTPPLPACLVGKYDPEARGQREGLRGSAIVAPGRSISKSVEALLCRVL